jgi:hypothetical protein
MPKIEVTAKGHFGFHPATGLYLNKGETYTIEEDLFSDALFKRSIPAEQAEKKPARPKATAKLKPAVKATTAANSKPAAAAADKGGDN